MSTLKKINIFMVAVGFLIVAFILIYSIFG